MKVDFSLIVVIYCATRDTIPLSAFKKVRKIFSTENETEYLVQYNGETYTLKVIKATSYSTFTNVTKEFVSEEVNKTKGCPFLPQPEIVYVENGVVYIIFKFAVEMTLAQLLEKEKRMSERKVRFFACQIALALSHLHKNNLLSPFLTMEKILVDCEGYISLNDFGTYRLLSIDSKTIYLESIKHKEHIIQKHLDPVYLQLAKVSLSTDWWDFGIMVYQMLIGKLVFNEINQVVQKNGHVLEVSFPDPFEHLIFLTDTARSFISLLLCKDSNKKFNDDFVLKHSFLDSEEYKKTIIEKKADLTQIFLLAEDKKEFRFEDCAQEAISKIYPLDKKSK